MATNQAVHPWAIRGAARARAAGEWARLTLGLLTALVAGLLAGAIAAAAWSALGDTPAPLDGGAALALSRAAGLAGYTLLWASVALRLAVTGRLARLAPGGPAGARLLQHLSLLGLLAGAAHTILLLCVPGPRAAVADLLAPALGGDRRLALAAAFGAALAGTAALVALGVAVRPRVGGAWRRRIHYVASAILGGALVLSVDSEGSAPWALALGALSLAALAGLAASRAQASREARGAAGRLQAGGLSLWPADRTVITPAGLVVRLQPTEARLLRYLMERAGQDLPAEQILTDVWGPQYAGATELVATYVRRLRFRIEPDQDSPVLLLGSPQQRYRLAAPRRARA